jgi:DNA replication ATP-dependent helicase Dna2
VAIGDYEPPKGQRRPEKVSNLLLQGLLQSYIVQVLAVREESSKASKVILLRQTWFDTPCTAGAYVHIIGEFTRLGECVVDDEQNMIILHPDHLISSTVVADSFGCIRRAVLQDRVKATNEASAPQVYGHILHEIFQEAMRANRWDTEWLSGLIQGVVTRFIESLCEIHLSLDQAADYLQSKMPELQAWASLFISAKPRVPFPSKCRGSS